MQKEITYRPYSKEEINLNDREIAKIQAFIKENYKGNKESILFALDDDIKNCEMYVKYGIPVLYVMNAEARTCLNVTKHSKLLAMSNVQSD